MLSDKAVAHIYPCEISFKSEMIKEILLSGVGYTVDGDVMRVKQWVYDAIKCWGDDHKELSLAQYLARVKRNSVYDR